MNAITITTDNNTYNITHISDDKFQALYASTLLLHNDYGNLITLQYDTNIIYSDLSKMYATLNHIFKDSKYCDEYKNAFSFVFELTFTYKEQEYKYLLKIFNYKSSIDFNFYKLIDKDNRNFDTSIIYSPFVELPRIEINCLIKKLLDFLTTKFEILQQTYNKEYFKVIPSEFIIFGYMNGSFFVNNYKSEKEYQEDLQLFISRQ